MSILFIETHVHKSACQFVYRRSLGAICRTQNNRYSIFIPLGCEPAIQKVPKYGMRHLHMFQNNKNAMFNQAARRSSCQFIYHGSLGAICRTQNNRDSIFSLPDREPAIQKVPKYGMRDTHMLYKISCPYFI
jgi:hypothetical protein